MVFVSNFLSCLKTSVVGLFVNDIHSLLMSSLRNAHVINVFFYEVHYLVAHVIHVI